MSGAEGADPQPEPEEAAGPTVADIRAFLARVGPREIRELERSMLASVASRMHYTGKKPRAEVDAWYQAAVAALGDEGEGGEPVSPVLAGIAAVGPAPAKGAPDLVLVGYVGPGIAIRGLGGQGVEIAPAPEPEAAPGEGLRIIGWNRPGGTVTDFVREKGPVLAVGGSPPPAK